MPGLSALAAFKDRVARAEPPIVVGERAIQARWAVVLGLLLTASVVSADHLGAAMARTTVPVNAFTPLIHSERNAEADTIGAPERPYRVDIVDQQTQNRVTSIHMDPQHWPDQEQRRFLRKLVSQADQRAVTQGRVLEIQALAVEGADQVHAQAFLAQAMREAGVNNVGEIPGVAHGLLLNRGPNDLLGSSPCLVATGDLVACIQAEPQAEESPRLARRRRAP